jgi:hypothetical protein
MAQARRDQLGRVQTKLSRWRARYGKPGRPIPEELWSAAIAIARVEGVSATARALGLNRARLALRSERAAECLVEQSGVVDGFVELDARDMFKRGRAVVRLTKRDGAQLEVIMEGCLAEVSTLAVFARTLLEPMG